jgi:DNA-directed RNA polymerase III subunit RPC8
MAYSVRRLSSANRSHRAVAHNSCSKVSIGFFEDMWVPLIHLPQPCALYVPTFFSSHFRVAQAQIPPRTGFFHHDFNRTAHSDPNERAYFWLPGSEATSTHDLLDSPETERLYIDQGEILRVRVERDEFCDDEPGPPKASEGVLIGGPARRVPYTVIVSSHSPLA